MHRLPRTLALLGAALLAAAGAQGRGGEDFELEDLLEVAVLDREVVAFDGRGGGIPNERLELDEQVVWSGARGRVGIVLTDRRALGVTPRSGNWREARYQLAEAGPARALLGKRVALIVTPLRVLVFDSSRDGWREREIGIGESVRSVDVGSSAVLVVTDRRAIALSSHAGGFFETPLYLHEHVEAASAGASVATVTTSRRVLVFRGDTGAWTEQRRELR